MTTPRDSGDHSTRSNSGYAGRDDTREASPVGAYVMTAGAVLFLIATFLSWIANQDGESFSGYEADSLVPFTAYLGVGLAVALLIAAQRSERRVQHRGLSLASMAAGIAAFGMTVSYLVDTPGAAERGSEWDSELGIYIALVGALLWAIGSFLLAKEPEGDSGHYGNARRDSDGRSGAEN